MKTKESLISILQRIPSNFSHRKNLRKFVTPIHKLLVAKTLHRREVETHRTGKLPILDDGHLKDSRLSR